MKRRRFWCMILLLFVTAVMSCGIGRYPLAPEDLLRILSGGGDPMARDVLLKIRLPRLVFAGMSGCALAVAGMVYQELMRNPLVSPDILGVSGGACVGAVFAILAGQSALFVQGSALAGGIAAVALTVWLSGLIGRSGRISLVLAGIVVKALMDAVLMACKYFSDPTSQLVAIDYWMMGSFHAIHWSDVWLTLPIGAVSFLVLWLLRWKLQILSFGEEEAKSLGVPVKTVRYLAVGAATLLVASTVSVSGVVVWTGLIVPHMVRQLLGSNLKDHLGLCGCAGAVFMILMDTLARSLTAAEIPVSILTSAAGAVFLTVILIHRRCRGGEEIL